MPPESTLSEAVLRKVADREGIDPQQLTAPLYDVLDSGALDNLFNDGSGEVTFEYLGYTVTVDHAGTVTLDGEDAR